MKKLLFVCLLTLSYNSIIAQEPTKQDAMDFIAKKFAANIVSPRRFHSFNMGVFKYYTQDGRHVCSIDFKKLTGWERVYGGRQGFLLKGKNLVVDGEGIYESDWTTIDDDPESDNDYKIDIAQEDGLLGRIEKALTVLVKSNTVAAGEKF